MHGALRFAVGAGLVAISSTFPLQSIEVSQAVVDQLNSTAAGPQRDALASGILLPQMQHLFTQDIYKIEVLPSDFHFQQSQKGMVVKDNCEQHTEVLTPVITNGVVEKGSYLKYGVADVNWKGLTVFADVQLQSQLDINLQLFIKTGVQAFHRCNTLHGQKMGLDLSSDGQTGVGLNFTASNAHLAFVQGQLSLVFNFHASVVGTVIQWNVDKVIANGCKISVLGVQIMDVCGKVQDMVRQAANQYEQQATQITVPNLLQRLQDKINTAIGSQVVIPIRLASEMVV